MSSSLSTQAVSFVQRKIDVTLSLGEGPNGETRTYSATFSNLRVVAAILKSGDLAMGTGQINIYGLPLEVMKQFSTLGMVPNGLRANTIRVAAGDSNSGVENVYSGAIWNAFGDFRTSPEVAFNITAYAGALTAVKPVPPTSYSGPVDVATVIEQLAKQGGLGFENNGVSVKLPIIYNPGSLRQQITDIALAAGISWTEDDDKIIIWPKGGARQGDPFLISPDTGMISYPEFNSFGVIVRTLFRPGLRYGANIQVESSFTPANGIWSIYRVLYLLESQTPNGEWMMEISASAPGLTPTVVAQ
jgi:hypothetical protein